MTIRNLPKADYTVQPKMRTTLAPSALERWRPEVQARDVAEADNTISILDVIGEDMWTGQGVTVNRIAAALRAIGQRDVVVNINSPGGNFFEGLAIYNALREHPAKVTVKVLGVAASAAAVIAMAGDEVQIGRSAFFMIHNTCCVAAGDRHALAETAAWLEPFDQVAVDIFSARTGMEPKAIAKMLDREAWIGGTEAVEKKFADEFLPNDAIETKAKASGDGKSVKAEHKLHEILARSGLSRSARLELLAAVKGGTRNAAATDMPGAVVDQVRELLSFAKSL